MRFLGRVFRILAARKGGNFSTAKLLRTRIVVHTRAASRMHESEASVARAPLLHRGAQFNPALQSGHFVTKNYICISDAH